MDFRYRLAEAVGSDNLKFDEPMRGHTTFCIGGPADYFAAAVSEEKLRKGIAVCAQAGMPWFISGNGSNLLVGDGGYRGVIFNICRTMDDIDIRETDDGADVTAGAGIMLSALARSVCQAGCTGFEYATGIPGTLGGGITMNAGAYGGEIRDAILYADVMDETGRVLRLDSDGLCMSYRHSAIMDSRYIVLRAAFSFRRGDPEEINEKVAQMARSRREKQPLEYPSAGSTFKRPEGYFAGKLIQDCGLKGCRIGGAQVSEKHSGFIINVGSATASDVRRLIEYVQSEVYSRFGVRIEPEVRFIGDFI